MFESIHYVDVTLVEGLSMSNWHKVTFSAEDAASGRPARLQRSFEAVFLRVGAPSNAGMFAHGNDNAFDYLFSPGAVAIAEWIIKAYGGIECKPPKLSSLRIVVANLTERDIPFAPES